MSEKISYDENCAHGMNLKLPLTVTQRFHKRHYNLINVREMWLFHKVLGDLRCF